MSRLQNPLYALPSSEDENVARQALVPGAAARNASPRERAYLAAAGTLFDAAARSDWHARNVAYAAAMEKMGLAAGGMLPMTYALLAECMLPRD